MRLDERIAARLDALLEMGQAVLRTYNPTEVGRFVVTNLDVELSKQWGVSCLNMLNRVYGAGSDHYLRFSQLYDTIGLFSVAKQAFGILKSAKDDYEHGIVFEARTLIEADVFDDFLGQAEHLQQAGYYQPAAVVAGAVLEDGLRKLCEKHGITLSIPAKLDAMNAELARKGVYNKLVQKQVTALADLRNKAAHGQWSEFTETDVTIMLPQIRAFMAQHFS